MGIKYAVNEKFFDGWSPQMAYVLGYIYADGSLEDASYLRGKYVRLTSTDRQTIRKIKKWLGSEHKIVVLKPDAKHPGRTKYFIRIGSHSIYDSLTKLGLYPKKSLTIKFPAIPEKFLNHFIRGYFDGDGCIFIYKTKGKIAKIVIKKLSVIFTSGSFDFLKTLCDTLHAKLSLDQSKIYTGKRCFQLRYSTGDSIKLFSYLYKNCPEKTYLDRKYQIFKTYFTKYRPNKADKKITKILKNLK